MHLTDVEVFEIAALIEYRMKLFETDGAVFKGVQVRLLGNLN